MRINLRPRLLPIVAVAAATLLGLKVADLVTSGMSTAAVAPPAHAQQPAAPSKPATPPQSAAAATTSAPPQTGALPPASSAAATPGSSDAIDPQAMSASEIDILQQLSQRRTALDQRSAALDQREIVLQAAEKRIDEKIAKLADMQKAIEGDVQKQSAEDNARIQSLVKIYEVMKPQDAAQIFDQLDMTVLLRVIGRMKELKTAPILAAMEPEKAKAVTTALAEQRNRPTATAGAGAASAPPAASP